MAGLRANLTGRPIGHEQATSGYGIELKSSFDSMEQKLIAAYGPQNRMDFLMQGSFWNEPRDWMQALINKERHLMSEWRATTGARLGNSLTTVSLMVAAYDTSKGIIAIEYAFENATAAEEEIAALEDDAL